MLGTAYSCFPKVCIPVQGSSGNWNSIRNTHGLHDNETTATMAFYPWSLCSFTVLPSNLFSTNASQEASYHNRLRLPPFWFHCEGDYWPSYTLLLYFCHLICLAQKYPRRLHNRLRLPPFWFHCEGDYWPTYSYRHYTRVLSRHSTHKNLPWPERPCNTTNNKASLITSEDPLPSLPTKHANSVHSPSKSRLISILSPKSIAHNHVIRVIFLTTVEMVTAPGILIIK